MTTTKAKGKRWGPDRLPIMELDNGIFTQAIFLTPKIPESMTRGHVPDFLPLQLLKVEREARRFLKGCGGLRFADNLAKLIFADLRIPGKEILLPGYIDHLNKWLGGELRGDVLDAIDIICCMLFAKSTHKFRVGGPRSPEATFIIGQAWQRLQARPREKVAVIGRKVRDGGKKGRDVTDGRYDTIHRKQEQWQKLAQGMSGSARAVALRISLKTGENFETIRKALRNKSAK
jgi:hypothetical protein